LQLQRSMNQIWGVKRKPGYFWKHFLKERLLSVAMILGLRFLLLTSLVMSAVLSARSDYFKDLLPGVSWLWQTLDAGISFAIAVLHLAGLIKSIPDGCIRW